MKKRMRKKSGKSGSHFESVFSPIRMSDSKRSQTTIFIVIAIILVAGIGAGYLISKNSKNIQNSFFSSSEMKPSVDLIKSSIIECRDNSAKDALDLIGVQGGYFDKPENRVELSTKFIPFYFYEGKLNYPKKKNVENELSKSVNKEFSLCIDKIEINGFDISHGKAKTKTSINEKDAGFIIEMPVSIKKEDKVMTLQMRDIPVNINSALYDIIEVSNYIAESHKQDSRMMCISCIGKMAIERNLYVDFLDISSGSTLVIISENYTSSEPYSFEFLNKYKTQPPLEIKDSGVAPLAPGSLKE